MTWSVMAVPSAAAHHVGMGDTTDTDDAADLDVVARYLDAWRDGDLVAVLGSYHPELTLVWPGSHDLAGEHVGLDASLHALAALQERTGRRLLRVVSIAPADGEVGVEVVEQWACGEVRRTLGFTTRDGQIAGCTVVEHEPDRVHAAISPG
jgi:ketosteroid isomerase-like protein